MTTQQPIEAGLLPEGQMNVLVDSHGVFIATNQANPPRWGRRDLADGSLEYYYVEPPRNRIERRLRQREAGDASA